MDQNKLDRWTANLGGVVTRRAFGGMVGVTAVAVSALAALDADAKKKKKKKKPQPQASYRFVNTWGSGGAGDGQFDAPHGMAMDAAGDVFVSDRSNSRIQKFEPASGASRLAAASSRTDRSGKHRNRGDRGRGRR